MLVGDIIAITDPQRQLERITQRLTPLCQGELVKKRPERAQHMFAVLALLEETKKGGAPRFLAGPIGSIALAGLKEMGLSPGAEAPAIQAALLAYLAAHAAELAFVDRAPNGFKALPMPAVIEIEKFLAGTPDPFVVVTAAFAAVMDQGATTPEQQTFLDVFVVADEVSVAGFESYFFLRAADRAAEALQAMRALGLDGAAALLESAMSIVAPSKETRVRRAQLLSLDAVAKKALLALSDDIQPERRRIAAALTAHVAQHRGAFR